MESNNDFEKNRTGTGNKTTKSKTIPVMREQIKIDKQQIDKKKVRFEKKINTETVNVEVPIIEEELKVETVPINKYVDTPPPAVRHEGNTMIISVLKEVLEKRLVLVEEVHVTKKRTRTKHSTDVELQQEEVIIKNVDTDNNQELNS